MPQVTLQRVTIDYRVLGPDDSPHPPVLFVHGILVDHRLWIEVAEQLAHNGFRCILPNLPLGSHTIAVDESVPLTPVTVAEMIHEFIAALDLGDATVVGNDTGGGICQLLVDAHPDDVGRLVLTNCDAFDKFPPFPFNAVFATMRGPRSIRLLSALMRITAVRHSPLGYGLLLKGSEDADRVMGRAHEQGSANRPESGHPAASGRGNGSHRRGDPTTALRQARDHRVGHGRPLLHPVPRSQARGPVPPRDDGRGAGGADVRGA